MDHTYERIRALMAAACWERCKGAMLELIAIQGGTFDHSRDPGKYKELRDLFEPVIKEVEENELQM